MILRLVEYRDEPLSVKQNIERLTNRIPNVTFELFPLPLVCFLALLTQDRQ